ncbi:MAG: EFR1 family ferrodoxin [Candidatus Lokiarchaeota archaeon]|nr:EFR1 family ferrodoxin [Candidatus Lokiarchaeota archaeon]
MTTEIYYFSGTGNSFYIARELNQQIPDTKIIPIAALLNGDSRSNVMVGMDEKDKKIKTKGNSVGFVFPCHGLTIPIILRKFLKKINVKSSDYFFAIVTRGGTIFRGFPKINKFLKKQGKILNASFVINMGTNDPKLKSFSVPSDEELKNIEINVQQKLKLIKKTIIHQENYQDDINGVTFSNSAPLNYILERLIPFAVHHIAGRVKNYFYSDSKCTGCGICEKVCPSKKIKIEENKPLWQCNVDCYFCYACLNFCPAEAIQIYSKFYMKSYTPERGRYPHPYAKVKDMSNQKKIT